MTPYKKGSKFYIKMYGIEYELILPVEENAVKKEKGQRKTSKKLVTKNPTKIS